MLQVKMKFKLKFFNLSWFSNELGLEDIKEIEYQPT